MPQLQADVIIGSVPPSKVHRAQTSLLDDMGLHAWADRLRSVYLKPNQGDPIESGQMLYSADNECEHMNLPTPRRPRPDCACWDDQGRRVIR